MKKNIDLKNREVKIFDVNTGDYENEIVAYLDKKMLVRFFKATFDNKEYVFLGRAADHVPGAISVDSYRRKAQGETVSVIIG